MYKPTKEQVLSVLDNSPARPSEVRARLRRDLGISDPSEQTGFMHYVARFRDISMDSMISRVDQLVKEGLA